MLILIGNRDEGKYAMQQAEDHERGYDGGPELTKAIKSGKINDPDVNIIIISNKGKSGSTLQNSLLPITQRPV